MSISGANLIRDVCGGGGWISSFSIQDVGFGRVADEVSGNCELEGCSEGLRGELAGPTFRFFAGLEIVGSSGKASAGGAEDAGGSEIVARVFRFVLGCVSGTLGLLRRSTRSDCLVGDLIGEGDELERNICGD